MNKNKSTKKALLTSVLCLLLCCSMLVGTTFAWFTDEVKSGVNKIYAGNLDVDVVYDNNGTQESIQGKDAVLFENILWEPGAVAYENITVKNLGSLALNFTMTINFENENYVMVKDDTDTYVETEHSLATALKVAVVPVAIDKQLSRQEVLDLVNTHNTSFVALDNLVEEGKLYPVDNAEDYDTEQSYAIIMYWEPSDEDNNWNVNNDKTTTDGEPLHINLGINLLATQLTYEEDSFDEKYDENANVAVPPIEPDKQKISFTAYDIFNTGIGAKEFEDVEMDIYVFDAAQFQGAFPVEEYKDWTCDFFVSTDKPLNNGLVLVGNYGDYGWLGFHAPASDEPYAPTGLLGSVSSGGVSNWTYEGICNEVQVFSCGLIDDLGLNAGTQVTVQLRATSPDGSQTITVNSITVIL